MPMHSSVCVLGFTPAFPTLSFLNLKPDPTPARSTCPLCLQGLHSQASLWTARW